MANKLIIESGNLYKTAGNEPGQGPSFEQQFGILANAQICDKYPILGNYLVAAQLLDKTDDNSFAVCSVVYKLGKNYIYVPAVFRNGKIFTGQIMEVPSMQRMLPLSDAWLNWVKNKDIGGQGDAVSSELSNLYGEPAATARSRQPVDPLMKTASSSPSLFDTALKLGKNAASKFLDLLSNVDYLNKTLQYYTPDDVMEFGKQACLKYPEDKPIEIVSVLDKQAALLTEQQKKNLYADGFVIKQDNKVDWGPAQNDIKAFQYTNLTRAFVTPQKTCKCKALSQDGQLVDIIYITIDKRLNDRDSLFCEMYDPGAVRREGVTSVKFDSPAKSLKSYKANFNGGQAKVFVNNCLIDIRGDIAVLQSSIKELDSNIGKSLGSLKRIPGGSILITPKNKTIANACGTKNSNGDFIDFNQVIHESEDENLVSPIFLGNYIEVPKGTRVLFNTYEYKDDGTYRENFEIPIVQDFVLFGDLGKAIDRFDQKHYKKLKITSDGQQISISGEHSKPSDRMQLKTAVLHLVRDYGVSPVDAKQMLKKAGRGTIENPVCNHYRLYKQAAEIPESDMWKPADIGYSEVPQNPPTITQEDIQGKAVQDARDLDVIRKATEAGVKEVFDTQTLKLLVQAADPHDEIMEAIPDFMNTLDRLCKILFLYRCHISDMEKKYGAVKLRALQLSLKNTIKDLSQLTVFLKLRGLNHGESPDAGDLQTGTMFS